MTKSKKIRILVTGIGGDIGIGIIQYLKEIKYHLLLIGCDTNNYPASKNDVDHFLNAPNAAEKEKYLDFILKVCQKYRIDLIVPSSEKEIKVFNEQRDIFTNNNIELLINNAFIINTFMDKYKTIQFFKNNDIPYPKTYLMNNYNGELKFPYVLKLKETAGSKGIFIVNDKLDLNYYKSKYRDALVQEIVGDIDNEYTIGIFSDGIKTHQIAFQRYLGFGSLSRYVKIIHDDKIDQLAKKISELVKLKGSINIQVRKNKEGSYIPFEINPRLSSTLAFRHYFGFEDLKWWIELVYGNKIQYIPRYKEGIGVKTLSEVYFDLEEEFENE